jgi:hypothetical protein
MRNPDSTDYSTSGYLCRLSAERLSMRFLSCLNIISNGIWVGMPSTSMLGTVGVEEHAVILGSSAVSRRRG